MSAKYHGLVLGSQVCPRETLLPSVKILSCNLHEIKIYTVGMIIL